MPDRTRGLSTAAAQAEAFLHTLDERPVAAAADAAVVRELLGGPLPEEGEDPEAVIEALAVGAEPGLVASAGPRHFGFVIGGSLPAALAADWLVSAWDQCAAFHSLSPASAAIEEIAAGWTLDLLGLPAEAGVGFVTGAQGANTTALAAARHAVLARAGWDVERDGLQGAPVVNVVCGEQAHATIFTALRLLGLGAGNAIRVAGRRPRAEWSPTGWRSAWPAWPVRRSCAPRPATSPPAPSIRCSRSPTPAPPGARGCTWTVPSGSGPRPRPPHARWWRGSSARTPGPWTRTSG